MIKIAQINNLNEDPVRCKKSTRLLLLLGTRKKLLGRLVIEKSEGQPSVLG